MVFNATEQRLLQAPALATPPGVERHMSTHSPEQAGVYVCDVLCAVVPGTLLALRLYTKIVILRRTDLTDCLTVIAYVTLLVMLGLGRFCLNNGGGAHQWNLTTQQSNNVVFWAWVDEIIYSPVIAIVKTVILLQYLRIFAPQRVLNPLMWWGSWSLIVLIVLWNFAQFWATVFLCSPIEKFWNTLITDGTCTNFSLNILLTCLFNIITDISILILPTRAVWKLQIPTRKKYAICSVFGMGLLACVANAMIILYASRQSGDLATADISYNVAWLGLWAYAEISLGLIVICTLSLPKFIEVKGVKLRLFLSSISRPFSSKSGSWDRSRRSDLDIESGRNADERTGDSKTNASAKMYRLETLATFGSQDDMLARPQAYTPSAHSVATPSIAERQS